MKSNATSRKPKEYRLSDLQEMAEQLGMRARFEMVPLPKPVKCEGCGKAKADVEQLVRFDSGVCLCNECVAVCVEIIETSKRDDKAQSVPQPEAVEPSEPA